MSILPSEAASRNQVSEGGVMDGTKLTFEMSPTVGTLIGALAKARKQFKPVLKTSVNPFFKSNYADLAEVIEATKDGLSDNGIAVLQPPAFSRETGTVEILTLVAHSSGEWIKGVLEMPINKTDAQGVGGAITYGRRYAYSAMVNVASEEDDDGNAAVSKDFKKKEESPEEFDQRTEAQQALKVFEIQAIDEAIKRTGKAVEEVEAYLGLIGHKRIEHVLRNQFKEVLKWANSTAKSGTAVAKAILKPATFDRTAAMRKLFGVASEYSIPEEDVKRASYEKFGVDSMTKLNAAQLEEMAQWVKDVATQQV